MHHTKLQKTATILPKKGQTQNISLLFHAFGWAFFTLAADKELATTQDPTCKKRKSNCKLQNLKIPHALLILKIAHLFLCYFIHELKSLPKILYTYSHNGI